MKSVAGADLRLATVGRVAQTALNPFALRISLRIHQAAAAFSELAPFRATRGTLAGLPFKLHAFGVSGRCHPAQHAYPLP